MEDEIVIELTNVLNASADFTGAVGNIFPLYADEGRAAPYAVYRIDEAVNESKDGAERYQVSVILVYPPKKYLDALRLKNKVKTALKNSRFTFVRSDTGFDEETLEIVSMVIFETTDDGS